MRGTLSGANEAKAFLGRIQKQVPEILRERLNGAGPLAEYERLARDIVVTVVYAVYEPKIYNRTFEFLKAVGAVAIEASPPAAGIVINLTPGVETTREKSLGGGTVSYARFMLPEYARESMLRFTAPDTIPRDFLRAWIELFKTKIPADVMADIDKELRS